MRETQKAPALVTLGASQVVRKLPGSNEQHHSENTLQRQASYVAKRCAVPASLAAVIASLAFERRAAR